MPRCTGACLCVEAAPATLASMLPLQGAASVHGNGLAGTRIVSACMQTLRSVLINLALLWILGQWGLSAVCMHALCSPSCWSV